MVKQKYFLIAAIVSVLCISNLVTFLWAKGYKEEFYRSSGYSRGQVELLQKIDDLVSIDKELESQIDLIHVINVKDISVYHYSHQGINGIVLK
ncbi:hypothetical protein [Gynuella sp.]|uniref:hypothetical protein n=1 Tax=Gynuella sp. TaxID=2969146 RepID=UPI003D0CFC31